MLPRAEAALAGNSISAKVVPHAKFVTYQITHVVVPRELFATILERIQRLGVPPSLVQRQ